MYPLSTMTTEYRKDGDQMTTTGTEASADYIREIREALEAMFDRIREGEHK